MATIKDKLSELKGQTEAELEKVNAMIAGNARTAVTLQTRKADLGAMLAEFSKDYPDVVSPVKPVKPGKLTP